MLKTVEAVIEPSGTVRLLEMVKVKRPRKAILTILGENSQGEDLAVLSEEVLAEDWLKPEEDKAWAHLQKGQ